MSAEKDWKLNKTTSDYLEMESIVKMMTTTFIAIQDKFYEDKDLNVDLVKKGILQMKPDEYFKLVDDIVVKEVGNKNKEKYDYIVAQMVLKRLDVWFDFPNN